MTRTTTWLTRGAAAAMIGPFLPWLFKMDYVTTTNPYGITTVRRAITAIADGIGVPGGIAVVVLAATALILTIINSQGRDQRLQLAISVCAGIILAVTALTTAVIPTLLSTGQGPHLGAIMSMIGGATILFTVRQTDN